jgi:perosamine synthetase
MYGLPVDMQPILRLAEKYKLRLIEDAAEMHGQTYMDRPCGSFGDISTFSFYPNKHITTGEGGMVLTDSDELAKQCRSLRNLCMQDGNRFVHERLGWNLRMTNMQAALGLAQLERLDDFINIKRNMAKVYFEGFEDLVELQLPVRRTDYAENIYWVFGILLNSAKTNLMAKEVIEKLNNQNIGARPFFYPMHLQPVLKNMGYKFDSQKLKNSEELYNRGFYIPSGLGNTGEEQIKVIKALRGIFQK